ncbi:hypothetical protein Tco_0636025, partial [Tanacetum coccineum]
YKIRGGGGVVAVEAGGDEMMVVGGGDAHDEVVEDDGDAVVAGDDAVVDGDVPASLVLYVFLYLSLDIYIVNKVERRVATSKYSRSRLGAMFGESGALSHAYIHFEEKICKLKTFPCAER